MLTLNNTIHFLLFPLLAILFAVVRGKVSRKWQEEENNFVELEMWSETPKGTSVGPGPVVGTLPSKPN